MNNQQNQSALSSPSVIKELLHRHGFTFSKKLGQNFLINPSVCPKMAKISGAGPDVGIIEIGPGIGVLTRELARCGGEVVAIEIDNRLIPILNETLSGFDNVKVINDDVLNIDLHELIKREFSSKKIAICANLPYYITSPIIMSLLESNLPIDSITVMVQKEAARRLCAKAGTRESGAVTLAVRYFSEPSLVLDVSAGSFTPAPKVDSAVIRLAVHPAPPITVGDEKIMFSLIKSGFGQRRKTLSNSLLGSGYFENKARLNEILEEIGIPPTSRAENLTLENWGTLAQKIKKLEQ